MKKNSTKSSKAAKPATTTKAATSATAKASDKPAGAATPTPAAPKPKATKPTANPEKGLSCLDAAVAVLKASKEPLQCKTMIAAMFTKKLWHSDAPTPAATLYSAILREIQNKGKDARFKKTERGHFTLNA